jgi:hypothetical protein
MPANEGLITTWRPNLRPAEVSRMLKRLAEPNRLIHLLSNNNDNISAKKPVFERIACC